MFASKDIFLTPPSGGYSIARSVRLRSSATAYLSRTPSSTTNRRTWTWSGWMKRGTDKYSLLFAAGNVTDIWNTGTNCTLIGYWINTNQLVVYDNGTVFRQTQQVFRDFSAWYHIVVAFDTTQATAANRLRVYINGAEVTSWDTNAAPTQNLDMAVNVNQNHFVGGQSTNVANAYFDGYLTEINFVDGQQLTPSSFGETDSITGVWKPKAYSGTYGTNGFELNFSDNSNNTAATIGKDYSGNGNNWTPNNISVTAGTTYDSMTDVPTLTSATAGNYCTWNPLWKQGGTTAGTWSKDGNLNAQADTNTSMVVYGTMKLGIGNKIYSEFTMTNVVDNADAIGIVSDVDQTTGTVDSGTCVMYRVDGQKNVNGTVSAYGSSYADGDVIGVAVDLSANSVTFYKNNTSQGAITGITAVDYLHRVRFNNVTGQQAQCIANWGQRPFSYTPPTGYVALNTYNLPASTITNGAAYMAATTYTGTGSSLTVSNAVNGISFKPDWVWVKRRDGPQSHQLYDINRGVNQAVYSNLTSAEVTEANGLSAFTSSGFTVISDIGVNTSGGTYVGWNWKASNTTASNTNGTITSTVSVGATQGFSVVTYTGTGANATVGHGLGVAPSFIIIKNRSSALNWICYHASLGNGNAIFLNLTNASSADTAWNNTSPTSTVFSLGSAATNANGSGNALVAYCFSAVAGYSAFGSYTGNGSADGPFIYTGFRPRWVMIKNTTSGSTNWIIIDSQRDTYNVMPDALASNSSAAESSFVTTGWSDFLSNGFKIRLSGSGVTNVNTNTDTYIYMAFAENPFRNALAR